jgi:hypothetical protein
VAVVVDDNATTEALSWLPIWAKVLNRGAMHMNGKRTILAVVLSLSLVVSALPAAAVSVIGEFCSSRFDTAGSSFRELTPRNTTFCYLSSISFEETDTGTEEATCRVIRGSFVWILEARLDRSSDADAECCAICYNN